MMTKKNNAIIYHCQRCGRVARREASELRPQCCGREMAKAAEGTLRPEAVGDDRTRNWQRRPHSESHSA